MQEPTFYWHDYETWGLDPRLDRPSQFAGIRTDMDFNVIDQPDMFYSRLPDDYLPQPEPALITGITPDITQAKGLRESEFANRINQQFSQINTCVVGYNNIRFDDEFSRNLFYRNFFDPYEYAWKNGNSRWDIIDLVRATYALRPNGINWPTNDQGQPSFRLELLTAANNISHQQAHDATSDVYATIAIAKLIKQKAPRLFNYYFELRNKNNVKALLDVQTKQPLVHVTGMFGSARGNTSLVVPVSWHPINTNAVIIVDLAQDVSPLLELSAEQITERLYTKHDQLGDKLPIPLKLIHINKCPFIAIEKTLLPENAERLGIDRQQCLKNLQTIKNSPQLATVLSEVYQNNEGFDNKDDVDAMLYDGFFSAEDKKVFEKIRRTTPKKLGQLKISVRDKRFDELFFRYRARNFPETLTAEENKRWQIHRNTVLSCKEADYFSTLDTLITLHKDHQKNREILNSLMQYAQTITTGFK